MTEVSSIKAWYPAFELGNRPQAIQCTLSIVEANGRRYLKTPFAFLDAFQDDDAERQLGRGYYRTEAECLAYLASEYPNWERAAPIMETLMNKRHHSGDIVAGSRMADIMGIGFDQVYQIARGHKRFTLKQVKEALRKLETVGIRA